MNFTPQNSYKIKAGTYAGGVRPLRIVLKHPGKAKVRNFTFQGCVDQDVAGSQVTVNIAHFRKVLHACGDATQHSHQLVRRELPVMVLMQK